MQKTDLLEKLSLLDKKIIMHNGRLYRVSIETHIRVSHVEDVKPTFIQSLFGGTTTYKDTELLDVKYVWLVNFKVSKLQTCFTPRSFIVKVLKKPANQVLLIFDVRQKLTEYFNLKSDFYMIYDLTPKEDFKKVENI